MQLTSLTAFTDILGRLHDFTVEPKLAVAVSGGGDSLALTWLLSRFCGENGIELHALTVDHGLREASREEAHNVAATVEAWPSCRHRLLTWEGEKPATRIQEAARHARYELMAKYCSDQNIEYLFLAHHGDDQAETFLFRLAKGSGLDGLGGMQEMGTYGPLKLVRPLLGASHEDLLNVCRANGITWIEDPSNEADRYARVRLRQSWDVLAREGLTPERINAVAKRLSRARRALDTITENTYLDCVVQSVAELIEFDFERLKNHPDEIVLRILQKALQRLRPQKTYDPSLQVIEKIVEDLRAGRLRAATIGGCIIEKKKSLLRLRKEIKAR